MKTSQSAMRQGWGQSCHGTNFRVGFWRSLYALMTGKRLLYCPRESADGERHKIPLFLRKNGNIKQNNHGFWSDDAGACTWKTAVTKHYVCKHPECVAWAKNENNAHDEYYSSEKNRKDLSDTLAILPRNKNLEYHF